MSEINEQFILDRTDEGLGHTNYLYVEKNHKGLHVLKPVSWSEDRLKVDKWLNQMVKRGYNPNTFGVKDDWFEIRKNKILFTNKTPEHLKEILEK